MTGAAPPGGYDTEYEFFSDLGEVRLLQDRLESALATAGWGESEQFAIKLAVEEAAVNAVKHGNQYDPDKRVRIGYTITPKRFEIRIEDDGPGFNPADVPDPTDVVNIERPCGRGLLLINGFMDEVRYHGRGNVVTMSKVKDAEPPADS
ncbi:ATP-binding protein [Urbifossiella limnaea]|uniref:Serine-protein kinase RsbW n=1 Tax=Urbifossiella limnaea TaxID=2528023 RepID=A0A517XSJ6_9BACT|nr:ATP-binding protein [Urbifossiella limnaea]QDU20452.1 Serine-protein kinase RsbW [Urbifossiella limnaea]